MNEEVILVAPCVLIGFYKNSSLVIIAGVLVMLIKRRTSENYKLVIE